MQEQGRGRKTKEKQKEDTPRYNSSKSMRKIQCSKQDSNEKQKKKQGSVRLLLSKAVQFCATFISTIFTYEPFASMDQSTFNKQTLKNMFFWSPECSVTSTFCWYEQHPVCSLRKMEPHLVKQAWSIFLASRKHAGVFEDSGRVFRAALSVVKQTCWVFKKSAWKLSLRKKLDSSVCLECDHQWKVVTWEAHTDCGKAVNLLTL